MILNKIEDPRSNLQKAKRLELVRFAQANGVSGISENMPAELIRVKLQAAGKTRIPIRPRPLGAQSQLAQMPAGQEPNSAVNEVDAIADLERQFSSQTVEVTEKPFDKMSINELRAECKKRDIHLSRRDNLTSMREKLGQSHTA